jgi:hypothetical protein
MPINESSTRAAEDEVEVVAFLMKPDLYEPYVSLSRGSRCDYAEPLMTVAQHQRIVVALSDELQTERARADAAVGDANDAERALSAMQSAHASVPRGLLARAVDARSDKNRKEARRRPAPFSMGVRHD